MALFGDSKEEKKAAELSEHISRNVAGTIAESIRLCMEPVFAELAGVIRTSLTESTELQKQTTENMATEFLSLLKQQTNEVYGALNAEAASLVEAQKESNTAFKTVQESLTNSITQLTQISTEQKQIAEELRAMEQKRSAEYDEVLGKMQNTLTQINATYDKIVSGTAKNLEEQNRMLTETMQEQNRTLTEAVQAQSRTTAEAIQTLGSTTAEKLQEQSTATTETLQAQNNTLAETKQLVSELSNSMETLKSGWVDKYIGCDEALSKNAATLLETIDKSNRAMQYSTEAFDKAASVLQSGLASMEEKLVTSKKNYEAGMEQNVSRILEVMDHQIAGIAETLSKTAEDISEAAEKIPKALRGITQ